MDWLLICLQYFEVITSGTPALLEIDWIGQPLLHSVKLQS